MSSPGHQEDHIRRIVLPSGKTIEVVCFDHLAAEAAQAPATQPVDPAKTGEQGPLHICEACGSHLVYPAAWEESGRDAWEVTRVCPNCDWADTAVWSQDLLEEYDEELDRGLEELSADLKRLVRANMAEEIDRFVLALEADALLPEDF
jgi:hypothetical protein